MTQTSNALLPPLVRREALRSYFERVKLLNSPYSGAITMGQARMKWSTPDWSLPTGLSSFANTYGAAIDQPSARYWVARHTLAPYYQTTLDWYRCERFLHRLLEPAQGPRRPLLPISLTEWFSKQPVLCPVCDEEALDQRGFSHVQRHWLLPFLTRCHIHGEPLAEYSKWAPPTRGLPSSISILPHRTKAGALLTEVSLAMLEREPWQLQELGELVQSRGFTTRAGRLRRNHLCDLLITHAKGRYEHPELDLLLASKSRVARLLTPLQRRPIDSNESSKDVHILPMWTGILVRGPTSFGWGYVRGVYLVPRRHRLSVARAAAETERLNLAVGIYTCCLGCWQVSSFRLAQPSREASAARITLINQGR